MAEVVQGDPNASAVGGIGGEIQDLFAFIAQYWWVILIILLLVIVLAIGAAWLIKAFEEKKREDVMYKQFVNALEACKINRNKHWVSKQRRWWILWVGGLGFSLIFASVYLLFMRGGSWLALVGGVLFSFGFCFPFAWFLYKDRSMRIIDVDRQTVGHYRGHTRNQDGWLYMVVKIGKRWLFFDDNILLKLPINFMTYRVREKKLKGGGKQKINEFYRFDFPQEAYVWNERENYIFIPMTSITKHGEYYFYPTLVEEGKIIDLRTQIMNSVHTSTGIEIAEGVYKHLSLAIGNAVESEPVLRAQQKAPKRETNVESGEKVT